MTLALCRHAREVCPVFPGRTKNIHRGFEDPPELAKNAKSEDEALTFYRQVRDEIRSFIETLPDTIE